VTITFSHSFIVNHSIFCIPNFFQTLLRLPASPSRLLFFRLHQPKLPLGPLCPPALWCGVDPSSCLLSGNGPFLNGQPSSRLPSAPLQRSTPPLRPADPAQLLQSPPSQWSTIHPLRGSTTPPALPRRREPPPLCVGPAFSARRTHYGHGARLGYGTSEFSRDLGGINFRYQTN
jgi:hypothetical protein